MIPQANRKSLQTYSIPKFFLKRSVLYFMSFNTTTYESYMHALKKGLESFDSALADEIIHDFESHFADARSQGLSDEEICAELGDVNDVLTLFPPGICHDRTASRPHRSKNFECRRTSFNLHIHRICIPIQFRSAGYQCTALAGAAVFLPFGSCCFHHPHGNRSAERLRFFCSRHFRLCFF